MSQVSIDLSTDTRSSSTLHDWRRVTWNVQLSRAIDQVEVEELFKKRLIPMQFSAAGHELSQSILGLHITEPRDGVGVYYRSRPLLLSLGLSPVQAISGSVANSNSITQGRDGGMVFHLAGRGSRPTVLPMCGDVGAQYTQVIGWAQAIKYRSLYLKDPNFKSSIGVVHGGDGSVATGGFWSSLNIATTQKLPVVFYIEDNGYAISVPSTLQTPGGDITSNLASFKDLAIYKGDGSNPAWLSENITKAIDFVRNGLGPAFIHVSVPRLTGHSIQDNQAYKNKALIEAEFNNDPVLHLYNYLVPTFLSEREWQESNAHALEIAKAALKEAVTTTSDKSKSVKTYIFYHPQTRLQTQGGAQPEGIDFPVATEVIAIDSRRINLAEAIRKTLDTELRINKHLVVFGQDVGAKGGIHGVTSLLQETHGKDRVFDTNLSEEGIIGRSVGLALNGLIPCPEIQFRKYADAAMEQIRNIGTMRWRTNNNFATPMVLRMTVGSSGREDHWHSLCDESIWAHLVGWKIAFPSNAHDATGLLRGALRGNDPVMFLEHRALLDSACARTVYPGDNLTIPFGKGRLVKSGKLATIVTWGQMVSLCEKASELLQLSLEVIDLRTIIPWDKELVTSSVRKTGRCLIVHEDSLTCGFGAEISATLSELELFSLQAPILRLGIPDLPVPFDRSLRNQIFPSVESIIDKVKELIQY